MAVLVTLDALRRVPYNDPHHTRDELIFYVLEHSYVLPIIVHQEFELQEAYDPSNHKNIFVSLGGLPFRKTTTPWKISGNYVYLISQSLSNSLSTGTSGLSDNIKGFFADNAYVTNRLHFIQFDKIIKEEDLTIVGFIVKSKYLKITTKQDEINLDLTPARDGDLPI